MPYTTDDVKAFHAKVSTDKFYRVQVKWENKTRDEHGFEMYLCSAESSADAKVSATEQFMRDFQEDHGISFTGYIETSTELIDGKVVQ